MTPWTLACAGALATLGACAAPRPPAPAAAAAPAPTQDAVRAASTAAFAELSADLTRRAAKGPVAIAPTAAALTAIVARDPGFLPARLDLALLAGLRGEKAEARAATAALAREAGDFAPAQANLAAYELADGGPPAAAEAIYRRLVDADPRDVVARLALARLRLAAHDLGEAKALCRAALRRQGDAAEAFRILAAVALAEDNVPLAALIVARGRRAHAADAGLARMAAQVAQRRDDVATAVAELKEAVRLAPGDLAGRAELAEVALRYRDFGGAAQQLEVVVKNCSAAVSARLDLAVAYKGLGRHAEAAALDEAVLAADPNHSTALYNLAVVEGRHRGHDARALELLDRYAAVAAADDPQRPGLAALRHSIDQHARDAAAQAAAEARARAREAAIVAACAAGAPATAATAVGNPAERVEAAWQQMAAAQQAAEAGQVPAATEHARCGFALLPDTADARVGACAPMHVMWTQILYQLGDRDGATVSIKAALACDPKNPDAQLIEQQLKELAAEAGGAAPADAAPPAVDRQAPPPAAGSQAPAPAAEGRAPPAAAAPPG